jgi:hypothetical protein
MYPDAKRVKNNRVTLRFDDYENQLILAMANYQGQQPATLLRELIMREAAAVLGMADSVPQKIA